MISEFTIGVQIIFDINWISLKLEKQFFIIILDQWWYIMYFSKLCYKNCEYFHYFDSYFHWKCVFIFLGVKLTIDKKMLKFKNGSVVPLLRKSH